MIGGWAISVRQLVAMVTPKWTMTKRIIGFMAIWPLQYAVILRGWASLPVYKLTGGPNLLRQPTPSPTRPFFPLSERIPLINLWRHSLPKLNVQAVSEAH